MERLTKIGAFIVISLLAACSSTYITSSWKAPNAKAREYNKLLVLGIMGDKYRPFRQQMENALEQDLHAQGINAISALEQYGPQAFQKLTEEQVNERIKKKGFDGVITISLLSKEKEKDYVPGDPYYTPFGYDYPYFWGYYDAIYDLVYNPGYYVEDTYYFWESNLYDLHNGKLVYSVQSKSFDPDNAQSLGIQYGKLIVNDLIRNGLIKNAPSASR